MIDGARKKAELAMHGSAVGYKMQMPGHDPATAFLLTRAPAATLRGPPHQVPRTKGLVRRSCPKLLSGPCPDVKVVASPKGQSCCVML